MNVELIGVSGLAELQDTLEKKLPEALRGKAMQGALAEGAKPIMRTARSMAPQETGRLRRAIYSFRDKASTRGREARLISVRSGKRFSRGKVNRDAFYWKWLEFGHMTRSSKTRDSVPRMVPATPFMRPAFESQKHTALNAIREALAGQIEKVAARSLARSRRSIFKKLIK